MSELYENFNAQYVGKNRFLSIVSIFVVCLFFDPPLVPGADYPRTNAVVEAVKKVAPAVVNISSEQVVRSRANPFSGFGGNSLFDSFFKDFFDPGYERRFQRTSLGSGVIIDGKRGFILTNAHVIAKTGKISVVLKDDLELEANIVGTDPDSDLAVLKINSDQPLPSIPMASAKDLMIGETVIAIGNPFGFSHTVTTGVISALNRNIRTDESVYRDFIQTDASINPGNSGGPLLNINGELIGINTAVYAKAQGIGFAIPIYKAQKIVKDLILYGEVIPAWIGINVQDLDASLAQYLKLPQDKKKGIQGVVVKAVQPQSPAAKAGIEKGDIILSVTDKTIYSIQDYRLIMREFAADDALEIGLLRNGQKTAIEVKAAVFPKELAGQLVQTLLGITVNDLTFKTRNRYGIKDKEGVVITGLKQGYYLSEIGVRPGDVIRKIDEIRIADSTDFYKAMIKYRQKTSIVLLLQREGQLYYITVKI